MAKIVIYFTNGSRSEITNTSYECFCNIREKINNPKLKKYKGFTIEGNNKDTFYLKDQIYCVEFEKEGNDNV